MSDPKRDPTAAVELPARLVFSLFRAAVRVAARVDLPLKRMQDLLRTAYFLEYRRRHPRDLATVADKLGVSLRTVGTLNASMRSDFFAPETRVEPIRDVTTALVGHPSTVAELIEATEHDDAEVRRAVKHLIEVGWAVQDADGVVRLASAMRSHVAEDFERRIDAVNHQLAVVADSVWGRFVQDNHTDTGARTWSFVGLPDDVAAALTEVFRDLRDTAVGLEERALSHGDGRRYGITVAVAPLDEEDP